MVLQVLPRPAAGPARTGMPSDVSSSAGPTPESISSCGELYAPAAEDDLALGRGSVSVVVQPVADDPDRPAVLEQRPGAPGRRSPRSGSGRSMAGRRNAVARARTACRRAGSPGSSRSPPGSAPLKSSLAGWPASIAASTNAADIGLLDRPSETAQRAADAVVLRRAALVVLGALEVRQQVVVAPAGLVPVVVVGAVAADVDHAVHRAGAAEHPAPRQVDAPAVAVPAPRGCRSPSRVGCGTGARRPPGRRCCRRCRADPPRSGTP